MPASSIDLFHMQDAKNNFNAMRPAPIYSDPTNELMGQCQNVHISRNCYYGYHDAKTSESVNESTDSEMKEIQQETESLQKNAKKRCADYCAYPQSKRLREDTFRSVKNPLQGLNNRKRSLSSPEGAKLETPLSTMTDENIFQLLCDKISLNTKGMVPTTATHNPSLLRPTHNNPDISRCLMVHMI